MTNNIEIQRCLTCQVNPQDKHACQLADEYEVKDLIIVSSGKFCGEGRYLPYFYELSLDGQDHLNGKGEISVPVTKEDRLIYPELKYRKRIKFVEHESGFVKECP